LSGTLVNQGTLNLSGTMISGLLTNNGTTNVTGSTPTTASGGVKQLGTLDISNGSTLFVGSAGFDWQGGTLTGVGNLETLGSAPFSVTTSATHTLNGPTITTVADLNLTGGALNLQSGAVNVSGTVSIGSGTTLTAGGASLTAGTMNIASGGTLAGAGLLTVNNVSNSGFVSPGQSPGILTITGNYTQTSTGVLAMEIGGTTPGPTGHDQLVVGGTATLDGTLNASFINGFSPGATDFFTLIQAGSVSGTFASANFPAGSFLAPTYLPTSFLVSAPPSGLVAPGVVQGVLVEYATLTDGVAAGPEAPQVPQLTVGALICE
jgi:hypothetical protein